MYCEKCGSEIEPSVICPKCGCYSGYKEPNQYVPSANVKDIVAKVLAAVGIVILVLYSLERIDIFYSINSTDSVLSVLIVAFLSFFIKKLEKHRIAFLIPIISGNAINLLYFVIQSFRYDGLFEISWWLNFLIFLLNAAAPILVMAYIHKRNKVLGILSITLGAVSNIMVFILNRRLILSHGSLPFLLFTIAIFLCLNKKSGAEIKGNEAEQ